MKVFTFQGSSFFEVMRTIQQEVGRDVIILNSQKDRQGVTVTVATKERQPLKSQTQAPLPPITSFSAPKEFLPTSDPMMEKIQGCLLHHRVPLEIQEKLIQSCLCMGGESVVDVLSGALARHLKFSPFPAHIRGRPGRYVFVGTPGAGKTTLLAKIGAFLVWEGKTPLLMSLDNLKAGASHQLEAYAKALDIPFFLVEKETQLRRLGKALPKNITILIDTPGIHPKNPEEVKLLLACITTLDATPIFVLPAGEDPEVGKKTAVQFAKLGVTRTMATRLDLVDHLGSLIAAAFYGKQEIMAWSHSPYIVQPLEFASPSLFAYHLVTKAHEEPSFSAPPPLRQKWAS